MPSTKRELQERIAELEDAIEQVKNISDEVLETEEADAEED